MSKQQARQLRAVDKIAAIAASVSNEEIQGEIDSIFANIISACYQIEEAIKREASAKAGGV